MDINTAYKAIETLFAKGNSSNNFGFFGGEPLLEQSMIFEIINYVNKRSNELNQKCRFNITTNGTIFSQELYHLFLSNRFDITLSVDGNRDSQNTGRVTVDKKGSFDILERNLPKWAELNKHCRIHVNMVLTPENIQYFSESIRFLTSYGFRIIDPEIDFNSQWSESDFELLEKEYFKVVDYFVNMLNNGRFCNINGLNIPGFNAKRSVLKQYKCENNALPEKRIKCSACGERLVLSPEGKYYPCYLFVGFDNIRDFSIGDIYTGPESHKRSAIVNAAEAKIHDYFSSACDECRIDRCVLNCLALYFMPPENIEWKICSNRNMMIKINTYLAKVINERKAHKAIEEAIKRGALFGN